MIQANELRLGNWVDYKGKYYQIYDGIRSLSIDDLDSESLDSHLKNIKLLDLRPIPITEEILLKCGFERLGKYTFVCDNALMQLEIDVITNKLVHSILAIEVKYLHQLQNLYYFLCGKELEINL